MTNLIFCTQQVRRLLSDLLTWPTPNPFIIPEYKMQLEEAKCTFLLLVDRIKKPQQQFYPSK
jgi:hypothetical protein